MQLDVETAKGGCKISTQVNKRTRVATQKGRQRRRVSEKRLLRAAAADDDDQNDDYDDQHDVSTMAPLAVYTHHY